MAELRLFAQAREIAGTNKVQIEADTVGDVLAEARTMFGDVFGTIVDGSKVWRNGSPAELSEAVGPKDEVAILPPVSGG